MVAPHRLGRIPASGRPGCPAACCRANALSRPGPAWNDEDAADSNNNAVTNWNTPYRAGCAAREARSAIWVLFAAGMPIRRCTASAVRPRVMVPTMPRVSHSVIRPNRRRPASSSWPSCAIAEDGASTPVARAIATGNANATAIGMPCPGVVVIVPVGCTVALRPLASTATVMTRNATVITAKIDRPTCPNHVNPATPAVSTRASGIRHAASAGT